jgi:hypothetical protein
MARGGLAILARSIESSLRWVLRRSAFEGIREAAAGMREFTLGRTYCYPLEERLGGKHRHSPNSREPFLSCDILIKMVMVL